jgi:hypothetical protein
VGEGAAGVVVSAEALDGAPHWGEGAEEGHDARLAGAAFFRLIPAFDVDAEEELAVLFLSAFRIYGSRERLTAKAYRSEQ